MYHIILPTLRVAGCVAYDDTRISRLNPTANLRAICSNWRAIYKSRSSLLVSYCHRLLSYRDWIWGPIVGVSTHSLLRSLN